jgi:hypothetical protein
MQMAFLLAFHFLSHKSEFDIARAEMAVSITLGIFLNSVL